MRAFTHLHQASIWKKYHNFVKGQMEECCDNVFFNPHLGVSVLVGAYKDRQEMAWLS